MKKRLSALTLALILAASAFSCGESAKDPGNSDTLTTEPEVTTEESLFKLPKEDNGDREFTILMPTAIGYEFPDESNGELVNDALFNRDQMVEEHFGIKFNYRRESGGWDEREIYNNLITNTVMAGDSSYDLVTGLVAVTMPAVMNGIFADLNSQTDIDLSNPWWLSGLSKDLSINKKLYCAVGDANLSLYKTAVITYFNKSVVEQYNLEDPYELVRQGKWTMDKMIEMSEAVTDDLNGDSKIDMENDRIGCYLQDVPLRLAGTALDAHVFSIDKDGKVFRDKNSLERLVSAYERTKLFFSTDYLVDETKAVDFTAFAKTLVEDRALFYISYLYVTEGEIMRNMKSDFGIIPYPKLDENQENHITPIGTATGIMFIPKTASDIGLTCRVMEALGYYSMKDVVPAYYEVALRDKYTRDEEVPEMLEMIRAAMRLPFDSCYGTTINITTGAASPANILAYENIEMASFYESKSNAWDAAAEKLNSFEG